jgi:TrmH family RNA methyltransferase
MISKADIKKIRSLSQKKYREEYGLFVVEGEKMVNESINSDYEVVAIYRVEDIGENVMSQITQLSSPSPVLAVVKMRSRFEEGPLPQGLAIALDSLRDPGNLGTIVRIADWFGVEQIYASKDTVDIYNPKVVQSTMGAIFRTKICYCDIADVADRYIKSGREVYGTFLEGDNIYQSELKGDGLIVMGSESNGIGSTMASKVTSKLFIPPYPRDCRSSESLNVAIATAITVSEFRRK